MGPSAIVLCFLLYCNRIRKLSPLVGFAAAMLAKVWQMIAMLSNYNLSMPTECERCMDSDVVVALKAIPFNCRLSGCKLLTSSDIPALPNQGQVMPVQCLNQQGDACRKGQALERTT